MFVASARKGSLFGLSFRSTSWFYGFEMLSGRGRSIRMAATSGVLVALLAGTFFGNDDSFPFGPFRMFSVANKTSGLIRAPALEGVTTKGRHVDIGFARFGLRRAEIEGQLERFISDPADLALLVEAYETQNPDGPVLSELHLVEEVHRLERGRPVEASETTLAKWTRS
jgi:hypothetical protein